MEIISGNSSQRHFLLDVIESDQAAKGFENGWGIPFSPGVESQSSSTYMLEMIGHYGYPKFTSLQGMAERLDELKKPVYVSTEIQSLLCQPYDQRNCNGASTVPRNNAMKIEEDQGSVFMEELVPSSASSTLINATPQSSPSRIILGNNAMISHSSAINPLPHDSLAIHSYGGGELSYMYVEPASEEGDFLQFHAISCVESALFAVDRCESCASNELFFSSEAQLNDNFLNLKMESEMYVLETMHESPLASMPMIEMYNNDGCTPDRTVEELVSRDEKCKPVTQVYEGKAASPRRFPGYNDCHPGDDRGTAPLEGATGDLNHPRIDFEEGLVQSHTRSTPEGKVLTEGSSLTAGGTEVRLHIPVSGLSPCVDNYIHKSYSVNHALNTDPTIHNCAMGNELLDMYTCRKGQLNDIQENILAHSCCSFSSKSTAVLQSATSRDRVDDCLINMMNLGPKVKKLCRQSFDRSTRKDSTEIGLIHLLTAGAEAVARTDTNLASMILARLKEMISCSNSTMERVLAYFLQSLEHLSKVVKDGDHSKSESSHSQGDKLAAFQILHEILPYIKFGHFTANQAILEAVQGSSRVHIVDFEILEGIQWPALMQALVLRSETAPALHITAVCGPKAEHGSAIIHKTCKRLQEFASSISLPFSYSLLAIDEDNGGGFEAGQIKIVQEEVLVVNCMIHLPHMPRRSMARIASFLQIMQRFSPAIVTLVEEELACSTTAVASYLSEALYHFHEICDSLEACLPTQVEAQMLVESVFVESSIKSTIGAWNQALSASAVHGRDISDKCKWSAIVYSLGLKPVPLSFHNRLQARLLLGLHKDGFELEERGHHVVLGWHGKPLYAASVWK